MTTIIIDYKNQAVYSDMQTTSGRSATFVDHLISGRQRELWWWPVQGNKKIRVREDGMIITGSGDRDIIEEFAKNYPRSVKEPSNQLCKEGTTIYVLQPRKEGFHVSKFTPIKGFFFNRWDQEMYVQTSGYDLSGSGSKYAAGALGAGNTPEEAIQITSKLDPYTGSDVDSWKYIVEVDNE